MRRRSRTIAPIAALLVAAAVGCARDQGTPRAGSAPATQDAAAPDPTTPDSTTPDSTATAAGATREAAVAPPLTSGHAPFLSTLPAGGASPHGSGGEPRAGAALTWDAPAGWIAEEPRNPMRRAQYRLPGSGGAGDGECAVFYFGAGQGGDAQANVSRWVTMLTTPEGGPAQGKVNEQKVGSRVVTRIEAAGTYHPMAMTFGGEAPPPQPGWILLGAVVPGPDANWFFRCAGPEKTIAAERAAFDACIASVREATP
jgi:hypothetical protein